MRTFLLRSQVATFIFVAIYYTMNIRRDVFQAIADPTRRAILLLVATQSMTAGGIAEHFESARPTVSKHLRVLTECALLETSQHGRELHYRLNPERMRELADFIEPFRALWEQRFQSLEQVMKQRRKRSR